MSVFTSRSAGLLLALSFAVLVLAIMPLSGAVEFGGDEGYSLEKAFLVYRGHTLYRDIWSDQPPLHTFLIAAAFRAFGPSVLPARLLSVAFASVLLACLAWLAETEHGRLAGLAAAVLLVLSPEFLEQSVSVMSELPALSLGLCGIALAVKSRATGSHLALVLSAVCCALSAEIKWSSAMLFVPALLCVFLATRATCLSRIGRGSIWLGLFALSISTEQWFFSSRPIESLFHFHANETIRETFEQEGVFLYSPAVLAADPALLLLAGLGLALFKPHGQKWPWIPLSMLATATLVHTWWIPFWPWYYLHFSIPLAWLAAPGLAGLVRVIRADRFGRPAVAKRSRAIPALAALAVASVLVAGSVRVGLSTASLCHAPRIDQSSLIRAMTRVKPLVGQVYADRVIYAFHAGLEVPGWAAVLSKKRLAQEGSGQRWIYNSLQAAKPDLLLLSREHCEDPNFRRLLQDDYVGIERESGLALYVSRPLSMSYRISPFQCP